MAYAYGAFPDAPAAATFAAAPAVISPPATSSSSPYSELLIDAAPREAASSPYGDFLGSPASPPPPSHDARGARGHQMLVSQAELLETLRESSGLCKQVVGDLEDCAVPHAAQEFLTVVRMCNIAMQRLERYAHLLLLPNQAAPGSRLSSLEPPSMRVTAASRPALVETGASAITAPVLSRASSSSRATGDQHIVFRATSDLSLGDAGTTAIWNSSLAGTAWMSTRATSSLCAGDFLVQFRVKRDCPAQSLRVGFMLEWVTPVGKRCVDWGLAGVVGASKSSWGVTVGRTSNSPRNSSSSSATISPVLTVEAATEDQDDLPGLKTYVPNANDAMTTIQVELHLPVAQPGSATFRAFCDSDEDTDFSWTIALPPGSVAVPAISLHARGQAVTLSVSKTDGGDCEAGAEPGAARADRSNKNGELHDGTVATQANTSHLAPGFVRKLAVQVQNALARFADQIQIFCNGGPKAAPSILPERNAVPCDRAKRGARLGKALSDPRQRRRVEHFSTFLCATVDPVRMVLHSLYLLDRQREGSSTNNNSGEEDGAAESKHGVQHGIGHARGDVYQEDEYYASSYGNCLSNDSGSSMRSSRDRTDQIITDPDGLRFWVSAFGHGTFQVPWDVFVAQVETYLSHGTRAVRLRTDQKSNLQIAVDNARSGWVNMHSWAALLQGFGPGVSRSIEQMDSSLRQSWFHGFISGAESMEALQGCRPGTFLVRFSQSKQCAFVIAYVSSANAVKQTIVQATRNQGFQMGGVRGKHFGTLAEVIAEYGHILKFPAPNTLSRCRWFHGFLTYSETVDLLSDKPTGTYLMRFSKSQPGSMVLAFRVNGMKDLRGKVQQSLIFSSPETGGYRIGEKHYATLEAVVQDNSERLLYPCFASPFEDDDEAVAVTMGRVRGSTARGSAFEESGGTFNRGMLGRAGASHPGLDSVASYAGVGYYGLAAPIKLSTDTHGAAALVGLGMKEKMDWLRSEQTKSMSSSSTGSLGVSALSKKVTKICWEGSNGNGKGEGDDDAYDFLDGGIAAATPRKADPPSGFEKLAATPPPINFPEEYLCPISLCLMTDPVIAEDSITYERSSIERWLKAHGTSPHTREAMNVAGLTPNRALLAAIQSYRKLAEQMVAVRAVPAKTSV